MSTRRRTRSLLPCKENLPPASSSSTEKVDATPRTLRSGREQIGGKIAAMKERWDGQVPSSAAVLPRGSTNESPTLAQLKKTGDGGSLQEDKQTRGSVYTRQRALEKMHHEAKSRLDGVSGVGGGVSLWPAMDDMRLSRSDALQLTCLSLALMAATWVVFWMYHGVHIGKLKEYSAALSEFPSTHPISTERGQETFNTQLLLWHTELLTLQSSIHSDFDVIWSEASTFDICSVLFYTGGILALLYFLVESMFSKNRLTPRRIKLWVCLLCMVMTWSVLSLYLLVCAQSLETASEDTVHSLGDQLAELVHTALDLSRYERVLNYWSLRWLPPTSRGVLSVLGLFAVRDVAYYLQYYSLPILTAICTPIIKLAISLKTVYKW